MHPAELEFRTICAMVGLEIVMEQKVDLHKNRLVGVTSPAGDPWCGTWLGNTGDWPGALDELKRTIPTIPYVTRRN